MRVGVGSRIGTGVRGAPPDFSPSMVPNIDLWLRGDSATTVNAAVTDGSNISTGNWTKSHATTPDFETIQDTNDGITPQDHYVLQSVSSIETGKQVTLTCRMKSGTKTQCLFAPGGVSAVVNLTTGATISASGITVSVAAAPSGAWDFTFTWVAVNTNIVFATASGGTSPYIGDGTGTIIVTNIVVTQKNVTTWIDISGNAHDVTQATAANKPVAITPSDGNSRQGIHFDGAQFLQSANVNWSGVTGCTMFIVYKRTSASGTAETPLEKGTIGASSGFLTKLNTDDSIQFGGQQGVNYDIDGTAANTYPPNTIPYLMTAYVDTTKALHSENALRVQGFNETLSDAGGGLNADLTNLDGNTPYTVGARGSGTSKFNGDIYEIIVYSRALSVTEAWAIEKYLAVRYNIPTDQNLKHNTFGLTLDLNPAAGITTIDAAIVDPTDFSTANWTPVGLSSRTAHTITEDNSNGIHVVTESGGSTFLNSYPNHLYHIRAEIPASSGNGRYVMIYAGSGGEQVFVDTQAGTVAGTNGSVTNATYTAGVLDFDAVSTAGPNIYFSTWDGVTAGITWAGNGVRTATCNRIDITQRNVSAWTDQSGTGNNFAQSTGASRPLYSPTGWDGVLPAIVFDAVDDYMTGPAGSAIFVNNVSTTLFSVENIAAASAGDGTGYDDDSLTSTVGGYLWQSVRSNNDYEFGIYGGGATQSIKSFVFNTKSVFCGVVRNGAPYAVVDGAYGSAGTGKYIGDLTQLVQIGVRYSALSNFENGKTARRLVYNRALSPGETEAERLYLKSIYGTR